MKKLTILIACFSALCLTACGGGGGGSTTGGGGGGTVFNPVPFAGTWTGAWNNTTFSTTGPASMAITIDSTAKTGTMSMDLDGNVFGGPNPPADSLAGPYNDTSMTVTGTSPTFGNLSFTVDKNGNFTGGSTTVPGGFVSSITYTGTINSTTIALNYTIVFTDPANGTANGTMNLTKSP